METILNLMRHGPGWGGGGGALAPRSGMLKHLHFSYKCFRHLRWQEGRFLFFLLKLSKFKVKVFFPEKLILFVMGDEQGCLGYFLDNVIFY